MTATVQLNARLDRDLKASGDAALALIGFSPTQAVRALWEKAAKRGKDLEEVARLLAPAEEAPVAADSPEDDPSAHVRAMILDFYESHGIDPTVVHDTRSDKEMLEEALYERMVERGLA